MDVALRIGVEYLLLLLALRAHHSPATPFQVILAARLKDLTLFVCLLYLHLNIMFRRKPPTIAVKQCGYVMVRSLIDRHHVSYV